MIEAPNLVSRWLLRPVRGAVACALLLGSTLVGASRGVGVEPALVPRPAELVMERGEFVLPDVLPIRVENNDAQASEIARALVRRVALACGRRLELATGRARAGELQLRLKPEAASASAEGYRLEVTPKRMLLQAGQVAGLRHAATTALQLLCARDARLVPALRIDDTPRFGWRGLMLDSARHYHSPEYLRRFLDAMALHKLNVLHWHLTDDQAWRLEIRKYPKLTEVGAWRVPAGEAAQADIDPITGKPRLHGGYYSQDTVRALVRYAAERGIVVVPEIEMPGHASAAIAAYPELGAKRGAVTQVPADWGIYANAFALDEATFTFLEDVLRETMTLFPSPWIHVGGDEVEPGQWRDSEAGQALIATLGSDDGHALQAHFTERIARFLKSHGRQLVGWDEILTSKLAQGAVVMSWRGIEGALQAAKLGHDTVLSPWPTLYFDSRQSTANDEPPGRISEISLQTVYSFEPMPATLDADAQRHVLGLQGDVWTEHIRTEARVDHMTFPRAAAIAELGWTPSARREWNHFARRLLVLFPHYAAMGIAAADSAYAVQSEVTYADNRKQARVALSTQTGVGDIRYMLDGSEPTPDSPRYSSPLTVAVPSQVRSRAFLDDVALARERSLQLDSSIAQRRYSRELTLCGAAIPLMLEDDAPIAGARAVFAVDIQNPCWIFKNADLSRATALEARVGQVPFNFQIGEAKNQILFPKPQTASGELEVRLGGCDGELLAHLPLETATTATGVTTLPRAALGSRPGRHDLCLRFAQRRLDPLWVIDMIQLVRQ